MDISTGLSTSLAISIGTFPLEVPPRMFSPLPGKARGDTGYPFDRIEVGGWFVVMNRSPATVRQAIQRYYLRHGREKRFVQRIGPGGHAAVWRVK